MIDYNIDEIRNLDNKSRIKYINTFNWVGYNNAIQILEELGQMLETPKRDRMPGRLLYGNSNNGKTAILREFTSLHPVHVQKGSNILNVPVLYFRAYKCDEKSFYHSILNALACTFSSKDSAQELLFKAIKALRNSNVRFIIIDEFQNILSTGSAFQHRHFLVTLKELHNELQVPIVICGTNDAKYAVMTDDNVRTRFEEIHLADWVPGVEFVKLLKSFEQGLPLRGESFLGTKDVAIKIYNLSHGILGEVKTIIDKAATLAIETGIESITLETIEKIRYIPKELI